MFTAETQRTPGFVSSQMSGSFSAALPVPLGVLGASAVDSYKKRPQGSGGAMRLSIRGLTKATL